MKATYLPKNDLVVTRTIKIINDWLHRLGNVHLALSNLADVVLKSLQIQMCQVIANIQMCQIVENTQMCQIIANI